MAGFGQSGADFDVPLRRRKRPTGQCEISWFAKEPLLAFRRGFTIVFVSAIGAFLSPYPSRAAGPTLPTGGQFVAGQGQIRGPAFSGLTINQSSARGVINWQSFSIGGGGKVQINNGSGATLNRVTGANLSQIDGQFSGTGSVYLINQNGVVVGPGGKILHRRQFCRLDTGYCQ